MRRCSARRSRRSRSCTCAAGCRTRRLPAATASVARSTAVASSDLVASIPATGQPSMLRGTSPQACSEDRPTSSSRSQITGHVFDPDPVELDVLPVGDVGDVAAVLLGDAADRAQLARAELAARNADPHHEVAVLDLLVFEHAGLAARDAWPALGVQAPPAEPAAQVGRVDRLEAGVGVPGDDPVPDVQAGVVLLESLGRVQRLEMVQGPLTLAALRCGSHECVLLLCRSWHACVAASWHAAAGPAHGQAALAWRWLRERQYLRGGMTPLNPPPGTSEGATDRA